MNIKTNKQPNNKLSNSLIIQEIEQRYLRTDLPPFRVGDTIVVKIEVTEGAKVRIQSFEGIVIAIRKPKSVNASFIVRKISFGEGVNRVFQTHSPLIKSIEIKRKGKVRKAKLYYLTQKTGKEARIKERLTKKSGNINKKTKSLSNQQIANNHNNSHDNSEAINNISIDKFNDEI